MRYYMHCAVFTTEKSIKNTTRSVASLKGEYISEQAASEAFEEYLNEYIESRGDGVRIYFGEKVITELKDNKFFSLNLKNDKYAIPGCIAVCITGIAFIAAIVCQILEMTLYSVIAYVVFLVMLLFVLPFLDIKEKQNK